MLNRIFIILFLAIVTLSCSSTKKTTSNGAKNENYSLNAEIIDAVTEYTNDNISKAESLFQDVLNKDKNNSTALYYLSNLYFQKQDVTLAIDYGKKAVQSDDNNDWYKIQLAQIYMAVKDYDNCASVFEKVVASQPEVLEYWQQLGAIYHIKGDKKGELSVLDRMEKRFGVNETTSMQKFYLYREQKEYSKAEQEIKKLAKAYPTQSRYYSILAEMKMKDKDYDKAFEYYNKVQSIDPDNKDLNFTFANYYMIKQNDDSVYHYLSKAVQQSDIETATKVSIIYSVYGSRVDTDSLTFERFFSLLQLMENSGDTTECQVYALLHTGYMRKTDFNNAAISARKAIDKGCVDYSLYQNLLFALSTQNDADQMIKTADEVIETYPEQPLPYLFKGVNLEAKKDYKNAIEALQLGVSLCGKDKALLEDFYMNIGDCYYQMKNFEECFSYYDKVLEINPNNNFVLNNYAYYLALQDKDLDKAELMASKVVEQYPDNYTFLDTYAWVLYKQGKYQQALEVMQQIKGEKSLWEKTYLDHYNAIIEKIKTK